MSVKDIIPIIYALRSSLNENLSHDDQVEYISDAMLKLERSYSEYDKIDVVKYTKQTLSDQLLQDSHDISIRNHLQMRGFEPIRRSIISTQIPACTDEADLLSFQFAPASNKKQKSGGYMSFNFDDFPMYESVDSILAGLRTNIAEESLAKILSLDISELLDHPLWEELLQTLSHVISANNEHAMQVLAIFYRFVTGFKGSSQGLDAMNCALSYLLTQWNIPDKQHIPELLHRSQLALFCIILQTAAFSVQVPYQKDADCAVVLCFTLLAKGVVKTVSTSGERRIGSVIDALSTTNNEYGIAISALVRAIHPFTAFSYAVQSGLWSTLVSDASLFESEKCDQIAQIHSICMRLRIALSLLSCFGSSTWMACEFVGHHMNFEGCARLDAGEFEFQGDLSTLAVNIKASGKDASQLLAAIRGSNKRFLHFDQCESLLAWFEGTSPRPAVAPVAAAAASISNFVGSWITSVISGLCRQVKLLKDVSTLGTLRLGSIFSLALGVCGTAATPSLPSVLTGCQCLLDLIEQKEATCFEEVLAGYAAGICAVLDDSSLPIAVALDNATALSNSCGGLLHRHILMVFSDGSKYLLDTQLIFARLMYLYARSFSGVDRAHVANFTHVAVGALQRAAWQVDSSTVLPHELRVALLQVLQVVFAESSFDHTLYEQKLVVPGAVILLYFLVNHNLSQSCSADFKDHTVRALLHTCSGLNEAEVASIVLHPSLRETVLRTLETEYLDADSWQRAADETTQSGVVSVFDALFSLLVGLASMGHVNVVGKLLSQSWGALIFLTETNPLCDLSALAANLCLCEDHAMELSAEIVYLYILRLLYAAQLDLRFCAEVAKHLEKHGGISATFPDADGVDATEVFIHATMQRIAIIFKHRRAPPCCHHYLLPHTEIQLREVQLCMAAACESAALKRGAEAEEEYSFRVPPSLTHCVELFSGLGGTVGVADLQALVDRYSEARSDVTLPSALPTTSAAHDSAQTSHAAYFLQSYVSSCSLETHRHQWLLAGDADRTERALVAVIGSRMKFCEGQSAPALVFITAAWALLCGSEDAMKSFPVATLAPLTDGSLVTDVCGILSKNNSDATTNLFSGLGVSVSTVVHFVLREWFFGTLSVEDTLVITVASVLRGPRIPVLVAAAIIMQYQRAILASTDFPAQTRGIEGLQEVIRRVGKSKLQDLLPDINILVSL